jgi:hypothetical protein
MPIPKLTYQLQLNLDLPEPEPDGMSQEEVRLRSETARKALESLFGKLGSPRWLDEYMELVKGGWHWRVAAYIAWASSPRANREPKTQDQLAKLHLGLSSDRVIATWRKRNPAIDEMVRVLQAAPLLKHRAEIFTALAAVAVKPEYKSHSDRKLALELMGDYVPAHKALIGLLRKGNNDELRQMSESELNELAMALDEHAEAGNDEPEAGQE